MIVVRLDQIKPPILKCQACGYSWLSKDLPLTPWGKFVTKYSTTVPAKLWYVIRLKALSMFEQGHDWRLFLDELSGGCQELCKIRLQEIIEREDKSHD